MKKKIDIRNKKAWFEYEIIESFSAGIMLTGTEIKSIRDGKVSFTDSYCLFIENELWLIGTHISEYSHGNIYNHDPKRNRKLLLNKTEILRISRKIKEKGLTIIPLRVFTNEKGLAKLGIGIAKGKKLHDKREDMKEKDNKKELARISKEYWYI